MVDTADGLYAVTSTGSLFQQVAGVWLKIPIETPAIESSLALNAVAASGQSLIVAGSFRQDGEAVPGILTRRAEQWSAVTGQPGGVVQGLLISNADVLGVGSYGSGRSSRLWRIGQGALIPENRLPYRPAHHAVYPWVVSFVFFGFLFVLTIVLVQSFSSRLHADSEQRIIRCESTEDLRALAILSVSASLFLYFGLWGFVSAGRFDFFDHSLLDSVLSMVNGRLHVNEEQTVMDGAVRGAFWVPVLLGVLSTTRPARRLGRRLGQGLTPLSRLFSLLGAVIAGIPRGAVWLMHALGRGMYRLLDEWIIATVFVRLPMFFFGASPSEDERKIQAPAWSVVLALLVVLWWMGVGP